MQTKNNHPVKFTAMKIKVTVTDGAKFTKKDIEMMQRAALEKLKFHKNKGRSAQSIIDGKILAASFVNKYFNTL